jgi:pentatricopeptide repeat protein
LIVLVVLCFYLIKKILQKIQKSEKSKDDVERKTYQYFKSLISSNSDQKITPDVILKEMKKNGITQETILLNCLMEMCFRINQPSLGYKLFEDLCKNKYDCQADVITFNILIKQTLLLIQKKQKTIDDIKSICATMRLKNVEPNSITFNTCIDAAIECKDFDYAWECYSIMTNDFHLTPDNYTFSTLLKGSKNGFFPKNCKRSNEFSYEKALLIFENAKLTLGKNLDEVIYNSIIDTCISHRKIEKADSLFEEMKTFGIQPSTITYAIILKGCNSEKDIQKALNLYKEIVNNLEMNDVIYGCFLNFFVKAKRIDLLERFYSKMLEEKIQPNIVIYTTMIRGYFNSKQYNKVFELYKFVREKRTELINIVFYNSILDCCVECSNFELFNQIYEELRTKSNIEMNVITYSIIIKGFSKMKDFKKAKQLYQEVISNYNGLDEVFFNTVIDGFAKASNEEMSLTVLNEMKKRKINNSSIVYSILIKMFSENNKVDKCKELLEEMEKENIKPSLITYTVIMQMYIRSKKMNDAINIFEQMERKNEVDQVSYNFIINSCTFNKKLEYALQFLLNSFKKGIILNCDTYGNVVKYLADNTFMKFNQKKKYAQLIASNLKEKGIKIKDGTLSKLTKIIYKDKHATKEVENELKNYN